MELAPHTAQVELAEGLGARRDEMLEAVAGRAFAIEAPPAATHSDYLEGLHHTIAAAIDFGIASVGAPARASSFELPLALMSQAHLAARSKIDLETVIRRYVAGFTLFQEFVLDEAESIAGVSVAMLRRILQLQAYRFDRLIDEISVEYHRERASRDRTAGSPLGDRLERLLAGEPVDTSDFSYDIEGSHLGIIAAGPRAREMLQTLAREMDCRLVHLIRDHTTAWAWLGRGALIDPQEVETRLPPADGSSYRFALGEPATGKEGWRLSHRQARAAWRVALRTGVPCVRYADVALPAALLQDDFLATSLQAIYLQPLGSDESGGERLKETLCAYLEKGGNSSSAAAALGVSRQTVTNRLRLAEKHLGRRIEDCADELRIALRFDALLRD